MTNFKALDLYAKVEDLLGVKEVAPKLYAHYFLTLNTLEFDSFLDVGCGSGDFLRQIKSAFHPEKLLGIDLSPQMVAMTQEQGIDAKSINLCLVEEKFDVITAVFDMLNYLDTTQLSSFLSCIEEHLNDGGYFLCDVNTLFGFEEVAVGAVSIDDDDRFVAIESDFSDGVYVSDFTLFEKEQECYKKSKETIEQYYYSVETLRSRLENMQLMNQDSVALYFDEADKVFLVFQKI